MKESDSFGGPEEFAKGLDSAFRAGVIGSPSPARIADEVGKRILNGTLNRPELQNMEQKLALVPVELFFKNKQAENKDLHKLAAEFSEFFLSWKNSQLELREFPTRRKIIQNMTIKNVIESVLGEVRKEKASEDRNRADSSQREFQLSVVQIAWQIQSVENS